MNKNLIIYFSRRGENYSNGNIVNLVKGNTEIAAEYIKEAIDGDLFEVVTEKKYSDDYKECVSEAVKESKTNERPVLKEYLNDVNDYENIFICSPCWCGTFPNAMFSLLERIDFGNKNVFELMTHEGSGLGNSENDLKTLCVGATFKTNLAVKGTDVIKLKDKVIDWAKSCVK